MDITPAFNELLQSHNVPEARKTVTIEDIDAFLKEAYRINSHIANLHNELRDVRQAYLSTAQPRRTHIRPGQDQQRYLTDREREEIDSSAKKMLRQLNAGIRDLEETENLRRQAEEARIQKKYGKGLLGLSAWAAGGVATTKTAEHEAAEAQVRDFGLYRDGVIWYLRQKLQLCGQTQQEMMQIRLTREMEKSRSVLARAGAPTLPDVPGLPAGSGSTLGSASKIGSSSVRRDDGEEKTPYDISQDLTPEQIQMFEKGNQDMMKHFDSYLDKVRTAEQSLLEISELQTILVGNVVTQAENIGQLVADSFQTTDNVGSGNKQLKKATQRPSAAAWTFRATAGVCAFLIIWDIIF